MPPPVPAKLAPQTARWPQSANDAAPPPELVHSLLASQAGGWQQFLPGPGAQIVPAMLQAQATAGNAAVLQARQDTGQKPLEPKPAVGDQANAASAPGEAGDPVAGEPPPAGDGAADATGGAVAGKPVDAAAEAGGETTAPGGKPKPGKSGAAPGGSGGGGGGGGAAVAPVAATPEAIQQQAVAVAQGLPPVPAPTGGAVQAPPRRRPSPAAKKVIGPPPVPMVTPPYAAVPDPIPESTKRIEAAANKQLPDQSLPPVGPSPGGHVPDTTAPLTKEQRRMILLGEKAMADAQIGPEEKQKLIDIRTRILAPPAVDAAPAVPAIAAPPITVILEPLPPSQISVAEQEMFTAVLARLLADTQQQAKTVLDAIKATMKEYPGVLLEPRYENWFGEIGKGRIPAIETRIKESASSVAQLIGVAGKTLDTAVAARQEELKPAWQKEAERLMAEAKQAAAGVAANATVRQQEVATVQATGKDARAKAKAAQHAPKPGFRQLAEAATARIQDKVGEAIARFQLQEKERSAALDKARDRQLAACEDAAAADELAATSKNSADAASTDRATSLLARNRTSAVINAGRKYVADTKVALDREIAKLKAVASAQVKLLIEGVQTEGGTAYRDLAGWGDAQEGATESWWKDNAANLDRWSLSAQDTAATWSSAQTHLARLEMQRDLQRLREDIKAQLAADAEHGAEYQKLTEDQKNRFVDQVVSTPGQQGGLLDRLAGNVTARVTEVEKPAAEPEIESAVLALPNDAWEAVELLCKAKNGGFSAADKSNAIYKAGEDKVGTDEDAIFAALGGLRRIELEAVRKHYEKMHGEGTLYKHLDSELSGDEWRRAKLLMSSKGGAAAAEAIHAAVWGPGTDEKTIMAVLRGLSPEEREEAREYYRVQYHESLDDRLAQDMEDSELGQANALLAGDKGTADAYAVDVAIRGGMGADREAISGVYEQVRKESMAVAQREGWTSAQLDAEIERRNSEIEARFGEKMKDIPQYGWGGPGSSKLQTAFTAAFPFDPAQRKVIDALSKNDMVTADAALMQTERQGTYADDSVLKGVIKQQYDRAFERAQLDRGPELNAGVGRQAEEEERKDTAKKPEGNGNPPWTEGRRIELRMKLQREADNKVQDEAFDRARGSSKMLDTVLQANHGISLANMIAENMSGGDRREAQAQLEVIGRTANNDVSRRARRLDYAYNRIRYSIEGVGTDMDELKGGLTGLTKDEIDYIDGRWKDDHDDETLVQAIHGDTSGREEGDLVDMATKGTPTTIEGRIDELRRKLKRDNDSAGVLDDRASRNERKEAQASIERLESLQADLNDPNLPQSRRANLSMILNQRIDNAGHAIEARRSAVDSYADTLTTIFQYVVGALAIVAGVIVGIVSGGTAVPALIAIAGSLIGTLGSMAIKQAVKGGAYGVEEMGTDLAVGAVDLVVTAITAGAFKGGGFLKGLGLQMKQIASSSIRLAIGQAVKRGALLTVEQGVEQQAKRAGTTALGRAAARVGGMAKSFAKEQAIQLAQGIPATLTGQLLNERNLRNGNPLHNIAKGTFDSSMEGLKMGAGMAVFGHVVGAGLNHALVVTHPTVTPVQARLAEFHNWQSENPGRPKKEFVAEMEARQAQAAQNEAQARIATSEARKSLLGEIPPRERAAIADVPIVHLSDAEFRALSAGRGGDAFVHVHEGQVAVVVREGAPPSALKGLAAELKNTVAPGTAGRTVNPADSLPERLRNRVEVEVSADPNFGADRVQAVPHFDDAGNLIGVKLEIGPNARAADIQNHVATVDAMRKLTGLAGKVRLGLAEIQRAIGIDVITPRERGRWEASLEIAKLPTIIEERVMRLSEHGLDPRRKALVMEEIATLERQYAHELERFRKGAAAEAVGHVAADSGKRRRRKSGDEVEPKEKDLSKKIEEHQRLTETDRTREGVTPGEGKATKVEGEVKPPPPPAPNPDHVRSRQILDEVRALEAKRTEADVARLNDVINEPLNYLRKDNNDFKYVTALQKLKSKLPRELQAKVGSLKPHSADPVVLAEIHAALLKTPEFRELLASPNPSSEIRKIQAVGERLGKITAHAERRTGYLNEIAEADARIATLTAEFRGLKGRVVAGVPLHPSLRDPLAGISYEPKEVSGEGKTKAQKDAHINGFKSELRLANELAERGTGTVVQYGNASGIHGADVITVGPNGEVIMWDSKYREAGGAFDSDTFTKTGPRTKAIEAAKTFLEGGNHGLPADVAAKAVANLQDKKFLAVTSHTDGGPFSNVALQVNGDTTTRVDAPW